MKILTAFIFSAVLANTSYGDDRANLVLRGYVPPSINTKVVHTQLSSSKSLVTFSSQINSKHLRESQKFEVEGLDQSGLDGHIKRVAGNERTIQYDLLINHLASAVVSSKPIFLKISAN